MLQFSASTILTDVEQDFKYIELELNTGLQFSATPILIHFEKSAI